MSSADASPIEHAALAMVNLDMRKMDLPELGSIEEFRNEVDRDVYLGYARAAFDALGQYWRSAPETQKGSGA